MKLSSITLRARLCLALLCAAPMLSGCVNVRYDDDHADRGTRMYLVAQRFNQAMRTGGMTGTAVDIESCYQASTVPPSQAVRAAFCMSFDYAAYTFDKEMGARMFNGMRLPYFEDSVAAPRWTRYAKLDGFGDPSEISAFLTVNKKLIFQDLQMIPGSIFSVPSTARARPRLMHGGGSL